MNLILIGYRGAGKSTIAQELGLRLALPVVTMDAEIERRAGQPIPALVAAHGWPHFRKLEADLAVELAGRDGLIVDAGGGLVTQPEPMAALRRSGLVFWLTAGVPTLVERLQSSTNRPSLTSRDFRDEVAEVLAARAPLYAAAAHFKISTELRSVAACCDEIVTLWRAHAGGSNRGAPA
ncbi:MAG: shikimate kinase [Planctomycetota bacterium]